MAYRRTNGRKYARHGNFCKFWECGIQVALNSEIYVDKTGLLNYTNRVR